MRVPAPALGHAFARSRLTDPRPAGRRLALAFGLESLEFQSHCRGLDGGPLTDMSTSSSPEPVIVN